MRQAGSKEYAHELVELLPGSQIAGAIELLESIVGTRHLALVDFAVDDPPEEGLSGEGREN